jgi:hypothetical protein
MVKSLPENLIAKRFREKQNKMWLYHTIPKKMITSVKTKGLDLKYHGTSHGSPIEHPSGKPALSYSTNKSYSAIWGDKDYILLVHVPTKDLFFAIRKKWMGTFLDEYQDINNIKPKDIIFPGDSRYEKIENITPYLEKGSLIK